LFVCLLTSTASHQTCFIYSFLLTWLSLLSLCYFDVNIRGRHWYWYWVFILCIQNFNYISNFFICKK